MPYIGEYRIQPLPDDILVTDMYFGERTVGGIVILADDKKDAGIRPRWAKVYAIGEKVTDVAVGQWVFVSHGRWSRGMEVTDPITHEDQTVRKVDPKDILCVYTGEGHPEDTSIGLL